MLNRRALLLGSCVPALAGRLSAHEIDGRPRSDGAQAAVIGAWMDAWMQASKTPVGALNLGRFADPIYYTVKQIAWEPDAADRAAYPPVTVPPGFITDLASIPRVFWSALRPDGLYAYAAIVHDYLYWYQPISKDAADSILDLCMRDFNVDAVTRTTIYRAVAIFGKSAWDGNKAARAGGEKRRLAQFPTDPRTTWDQWKAEPAHFSDDG